MMPSQPPPILAADSPLSQKLQLHAYQLRCTLNSSPWAPPLPNLRGRLPVQLRAASIPSSRRLFPRDRGALRQLRGATRLRLRLLRRRLRLHKLIHMDQYITLKRHRLVSDPMVCPPPHLPFSPLVEPNPRMKERLAYHPEPFLENLHWSYRFLFLRHC